jgi:phage terminase Nu1 subunit (DNA packaging protein)
MSKVDAVDATLVTRQALAKIFRKNARTIARWMEAGLPVAIPGRGGRPSRYSLPDCVQWYVEQELRARGGETGATLSPSEQRALLDEKRREELDLRIRMRRGELVEVDEAARDLANVASATKARMRRIPDSVAEKLVTAAKRGPAHVKALLLGEIDDALRELAAHGEPAETAA